MTFQSTVEFYTASGFPGDKWGDAPSKGEIYILDSVDPAYNIIGSTIFTVTSQTGLPYTPALVAAGGTGAFAGLLVNSNIYPLTGTAGDPLAATLVLPNGINAEIVSQGSYVVDLPAPAAVGDWVIYDTTTGAISTQAPGVIPGGFASANAYVDYANVTVAGLGVITLVSQPIG